MMNNRSVAAVIVTYGDRWKWLEKVLLRVSSLTPIKKIIVVNNGSNIDIAGKIGSLRRQIKVISNQENLGSASGIKTGLKDALESEDIEFVWTLDDDNLPAEDALEKLLVAYDFLGSNWYNAILSLRKGRREYELAAERGKEISIRTDSFLGFHLYDIVSKFLQLKGMNYKQTGEQRFPLCLVGYAPYGGLFLNRRLVEKIGFPKEDFFVYADDHEYTERIYESGGKIYLCANSTIDDIDLSWNQKKYLSHRLISVNNDLGKLYYSVRNRIYLERSRHFKNKFIYEINGFVYLFILTMIGLLKDRRPLGTFKRVRTLFRAIREGKIGRLGKNF